MYRMILNMAFLLIMGTGFSLASTLVKPEKFIQDTITKEKRKVTMEQLPQAVRDVLKSNLYNTWRIVSIHFVKKETEYYEIVLSRDTETKNIETQILNLDKFGKKVKTV